MVSNGGPVGPFGWPGADGGFCSTLRLRVTANMRAGFSPRWTGVMQADAYSGHDALYAEEPQASAPILEAAY